jgi:GT2 family glycosyltransferase/glycosyltransferase involved in cell wall biosynthesis
MAPSAVAALGAASVRYLADGTLDNGSLEGMAAGDDVLACLDPAIGDVLLARVSRLGGLTGGGLMGPGGIIAAICADDLGAVLADAFPHAAHYLCRPLAGSLIFDAEFARGRVVALRDQARAGPGVLHLWICSGVEPPPLRAGVFEATDDAVAEVNARVRHRGVPSGALTPSPTRTPRLSLARENAALAHQDMAARDMAHQDMAARASALGERLLAVDSRTFELRRRIMALERERAMSGSAPTVSQAFFDVPRTEHPWPLARDPALEPGDLGLYDRRVDDAVVLQGRLGRIFMAAHALESEEPDFAGCVAALNATVANIRAIVADDETPDVTPDVTVVIPVYGQLAYTLNCIDSILRHASRYSVEILIIDDCSPDTVTERYLPMVDRIRYHRQPKNGGFINSCNTGGAMARGRYVLMLNNDTRVVDGWLDALLDSFDLFPGAGLVGSKMCYPDGSLQEAGGILWRDGGAWNYGRNDDPNRPQYSYARRVDYISGCSLVLPTELWRRLGGFDAHYKPAYAEDADLCMRVGAAGKEVWYQAQSRVVHYEGKTGGTDTGGGVKAYQVINLKKLFMRWRQTFETHRPNAEAPFLERERHVRKRFLVIDAIAPTPDQDAGSVQTVLGMRCCRDLGYKTHFIPEDNWLFVPGYIPALQREGIDCAYAPYEVGAENYLRRYGWSFDVVMVYRVGILERTIDLLRQYAPQAAIIYHVADLHFLRMERQARLDDSQPGLEAAAAQKEKELDLVRRADCTVTHSTVEAEILAQEVPGAPVTVWPLMLDFFGTDVPFAARRDICFLGGYRHPPNVDAVRYFVREVFPLIKAELPGARFIVAGANPTGEIVELAGDDVIVTGMVDDLRDVFDAVRVFVCPLRVGAGAKGKIMSALSYGLPIVSTPIGVEGAGLTPDEHVLVTDTPEDMARETVRLYRDEGLWTRLSLAGQQLMRDEFSTAMGDRKLEEAVDKAYRHKIGLD